mmetsp:Transcript_34276/g.60254  ORF Transcript_34276/g.60254 Transcript_34276/m.60254 type:complete len:599 (-) Transcript_34276:206-2002(-)
MRTMEQLSIANQNIKTAHDDHERDYKKQIDKLNCKEEELLKRLSDLDKKKLETAEANGNVDAADDDIVEINAGGKIVAAKRSTLTQLKGTRLEALFSGRWDKKLQKDSTGRIFLDVSPVGFQAIVDYLNEMTISSEDNPPVLPRVDDEHKHILQHQLELFGLLDEAPAVELPESNIIKDEGHATQLHDWLKEDESDGDLSLLYRGSRDSVSGEDFHSTCDNQGCTLTVIETTCGFVFGGYSNTPWTSSTGWSSANKAFLFVLSGSDITSPCKMKLKNANDGHAVHRESSYGPYFGCHELLVNVNESNVLLKFGNTYEPGPWQLNNNGSHKVLTIKEMEVFQVSGNSSLAAISTTKEEQTQLQIPQVKPVNKFSQEVNEAINAKQESLLHAESEILHLEDSFRDEHNFVATFASGEVKDIVALNVSGTMMITKRSTLCIAEDSVLAQQFDDSKWTEQGRNAPRIKEWAPDDVFCWTKSIDDISDDVANVFVENEITGNELLALNMEGLKMIGIERAGTLCLLLEEIKILKQASSDVVTLIEHSPYCFGKILDYLRLKQLHSQGLAEEPALPTVCDSQKSRFDKVVKYFFPGDSAKIILG